MIMMMTYLLAFLAVIGILVTIHEWGHFWVARRLGVKVLCFSIGFGKPLLQWRGKDGTQYQLGRLPLGGYVKMLGEEAEAVEESEKSQSFSHQSLPRRAAIVVAGPVANLLLAIGLYWAVFMIGIPGVKPVIGQIEPHSLAAQAGLQSGEQIVRINQDLTPTWGEVILALLSATLRDDSVVLETRLNETTYRRTLNMSQATGALNGQNLFTVLGFERWQPQIPARVAEVAKDSRAAQAGFQAGDFIVAADDKAIDSWQAWVDYVSKRPEQLIQVRVQRQAVSATLALTPRAVTLKNKVVGQAGLLASIPAEIKQQLEAELQYGMLPALGAALQRTGDISLLTLRMFGKMVMGQAALTNISGPISIAQYAGDSASLGIVPFLIFLALVSISLGIINLLPIPLLDGGHLFYYMVEAIKGSPVSETALFLGQRLGLSLLLMLMALAFYNDLVRVLG